MANMNVAKGASLQAVTANRLDDGIVVYLGQDGRWSEDLGAARLAETKPELEALEEDAAKAVADRIVIGPYPIAVVLEDGIAVATSVRERIRASHRTTLTKDWYDVPLR